MLRHLNTLQWLFQTSSRCGVTVVGTDHYRLAQEGTESGPVLQIFVDSPAAALRAGIA